MGATEKGPKTGPGKMIKNKTDLVILVVLCLVEFHGFFSFSMIAPFYPKVAKERYKVSSTVEGLVFAIHPLVVFVLSPYVGKLISKPGRTKLFILVGTIGIAGGNALFAFVTNFSSKYVFLTISFAARIIIALGTALANTAALAFLTEKFKAHLSTVFGITELFVGVGFMSGPSVGGVLYDVAFWVPFIFVASMNALNLAFLWFFIPADGTTSTSYDVNAVNTDNVESNSEKKVTIRRSLSIPGVWAVCWTIHTIGFFLTFIQPTFTFHLDEITHNTISESRKGLVFFLCPGVYAILAPILGIYIDKWFIPRNLIIVGHFMVAACYIFMGPSPIFSSFISPSLTVTSVAYALLGVAQCPIMVPVIADLQIAIVNAGYPKGQRTSSVVSGLFTSAINLGQVMGPLIGGLLQEYMKFPSSSSVVALFVLVEGLLILFFTMYEQKTWKIFCKKVVVEVESKPTEMSEPDGAPSNGTPAGITNVTYDHGEEVVTVTPHNAKEMT